MTMNAKKIKDTKVEVSFAEDTTRLRCPMSVRDLLTQSDYVLRAEQTFPRIMEEMLLERKTKINTYHVY